MRPFGVFNSVGPVASGDLGVVGRLHAVLGVSA